MRYKCCGKILMIALLANFWKTPLYGDPRTAPPTYSGESGTRQYSEYEVDTLIEDLTVAAVEAIEQAAGEAAKAAALASVEREAAAVREAAWLQAETERLQRENNRLQQGRVKVAVVTGVICFLSGLAIGSGTTAILAGR
jgi:hypothetical protein